MTAAEKKETGTYRADRDRRAPKFDTKGSGQIKPPALPAQNKLALAEWKAVSPIP